jgi:FkbM family methyltransferase
MLRWQLSPVGKALHRRAKECGYEISCRPDGIRLRQHEAEIWFHVKQAGFLWKILPELPRLRARFVPQPRRGRQVVDCRKTACYRIVPGQDHVWLPSFPEIEDVIGGYLKKGAPQPGQIVFDAGAFCGEMTLIFSRMVGPTGRVFAFEPDPANLSLLKRNLAEAGATNVTVVERGLWKETTELTFVTGMTLGSHVASGRETGSVKLPVLSFADACRLAGRMPDFVKMDIEGAEIEVIEGALTELATARTRFAIASYHERDGGQTAGLLEPLLRRAGYQVETGHPEHLTTWAWKE